jgi:DNA-3-methyladenine glycosylase
VKRRQPAPPKTPQRTQTECPPDRILRFDPHALGMQELPRDFFRLDTGLVARSIIGTWLARRYRNEWYGARIVETEAYLGAEDAAAHSYRGRRTQRVEPMYLDGGHLYVFLVYGMHHCANVVTRPEGIAEAVLLRAAEAPAKESPKLLSGPGKLCAAMGITVAHSGVDILSGGDLKLFAAPHSTPNIGISKRIGVDYAGEAASWPLRFFDLNSPAISGPSRLKTNS